MAHQTSPNLKIPACASLTPRNPTSSSAAIGWTTQLIPRPLSCAVCVRSTTDGKCLVYAHCPQEMQRIIPHCNKQLVGSLPKDCVRNQIFMTLKIPCNSSSLEKKDFNKKTSIIFLFTAVRLILTRIVHVRLFIAYSHRIKVVLGFSVLHVMLIN